MHQWADSARGCMLPTSCSASHRSATLAAQRTLLSLCAAPALRPGRRRCVRRTGPAAKAPEGMDDRPAAGDSGRRPCQGTARRRGEEAACLAFDEQKAPLDAPLCGTRPGTALGRVHRRSAAVPPWRCPRRCPAGAARHQAAARPFARSRSADRRRAARRLRLRPTLQAPRAAAIGRLGARRAMISLRVELPHRASQACSRQLRAGDRRSDGSCDPPAAPPGCCCMLRAAEGCCPPASAAARRCGAVRCGGAAC
jgi:hypothetical protein